MDRAQINAVLDAPALPPPDGVVPHFDHPHNLSQPGLAVLQLTVTTVVVGIRVYTKLGVVKKMLAEDYWLIVAWICFVGLHVIVFMSEALPLGVHQWDLTVRKAIKHARLFYISVAVYSLVIIPLKVSLILQIRRIFMPHNRSLHARPFVLWTIDSFLVLNVIYYISLILFQFLACRPLAHAWNPLVLGTCVKDKLVVHIISASINTASDLIIVTLPQPIIWRLELSKKRKWGLSAVFLFGGLACAASSIRLYYAVKLYYSTDQTYRAAVMGKWIEPELTFGFLAACLPVLPAFIKHLLRTQMGLKIRGLWTQSPISKARTGEEGYAASGGGRQVRTIGSYGRSVEKSGRITRVVEMDIEFEELTRESRDGVTVKTSRDTSRDRDEEWVVGGS
ncbi:hypothetical protein EKO04_002284 [Ascochyta lentis]|uniref:Rhodopsin domain-containing protein n=1 Tax=Ascochyta lentis TaxID=205686 RepID=A0A8H7MLE0_9PLEO|nr:hypothetical protein EKO04_002284 [Ascochyta lentis]